MFKASLIKEVTVQEAKSQFESLMVDVEKNETQVIVRDGGRVVARIVPDPEGARRRFFARADVLQRRLGDVPTAELNRLVDDAVREVRESRRQRSQGD